MIPRKTLAIGTTAHGERIPGTAAAGGSRPEQLDPPTAVYSALAAGSTANAPSGESDGVITPVGRVFAEARSVTTSDGAATVEVTLTAARGGVRCTVRSRASGSTITAGSVRFWVQNHKTKQWALGGVDETLPTGAQEVAPTDQFAPVGG